MRLSLVRKTIIYGLAGAAIGLGSGVAIKKAAQFQQEHLSASLEQRNVFGGLPLGQIDRLKWLVEKRALPCGPDRGYQPYVEREYTTSRGEKVTLHFQADLPSWQQLVNCHAAAYWLVAGGEGVELQIAAMFPEEMPALLGKKGFNVVADVKPLDQVSYQLLQPGDLLIFKSKFADQSGKERISIEHSAVYLGEVNGERIVFQKNGLGCGEKSPFEIVSLFVSLASYQINWQIVVMRRGL